MDPGKKYFAITAAALLVVAASCKDVVAPPAPVATITLSTNVLELVPTETEQLTAVPRESAGTPLTRTIAWSSSEPGVATVVNGLVTARGIGTAVITATSEGIKADANVVVDDGGIMSPAGNLITGLGGSVFVDVPSAAVGQSARIVISQADPVPPGARLVRGTAISLRTQMPLTHPAVLTIRYNPEQIGDTPEAGLRMYQALSGGWQPLPASSVDVTAKTVRGEISGAGIYGILVQAAVAKVSIAPNTRTLKAGDTASFKAAAEDADGNPLSGRSVVWSSSSDDVLAIDASTGIVTARAPGSATITAMAEGKQGSAAVVVTPGEASSILIVAGDKQTADTSSTVLVAPSVRVTDGLGFNVPGVTVSFGVTSGGGSISPATAVTDNSGIASATRWVLGPTRGPNSVTASIPGGKSVTFDATASQPPPPVAKVTVTPVNPTLPLTQTLGFSAVALDADGNPLAGRAISWSGSNNDILQIDAATGIASGKQPGSAVVTATVEGKSASTTVQVVPGPATRIFIVAGNQQTADTSSAVSIAPSVRVNDKAGYAIVGASVSFVVTAGGGSVTPATVQTDGTGTATVNKWVMGRVAGNNALTATVAGAGSITLTATATQPSGPPPPAAMSIFAGQGQSANAFASVAVAPAVKVTDAAGNPVAGVGVTFSVGSGGGSIIGENPTTNSQGIATLGRWTLGDAGANTLIATRPGLAGNPLTFNATAIGGVRIVTFGDSNTDAGYYGTNPTFAAVSYVSSDGARPPPEAPNHPTQLAGKIEAKWSAVRSTSITAVNHGISGTRTGGGRTGTGAPNAREVVNGVARFNAEVLGAGFPWNGGEFGESYPQGSIIRRRAFVPNARDFVYVSMGTNDFADNLTTDQSAANISWMIDQWVSAGRSPDHFILTTLAPRISSNGLIPPLNDRIRSIAAARGVGFIDLTARTSDDNGATWRSAADHVGDSIHYSEGVRDWLADQVVKYILLHQ